jgi:hypothetical protein
MNAEQMAKMLGNAKRYKRGWLASCPVPGHGSGNGDKNPSLAITDGDNKLLFRCFGGCDQESVFNAVKPMLGDGRLAWNSLPPRTLRNDQLDNVKPIRLREVYAWDYVTDDGEITAQKVRYELPDGRKTYRQFRIVEGQRIPTISGWEPIPFQLPLMSANPNKVVFITEGEKAAEHLAAFLGVVAVSAHAGASDWPEAITPYFKDRNVVILPDHDLPGWRYAAKVASALQGVAAQIRVIDLGMDVIGDDAYEWLDQENDLEDLKALVHETPVWQGEAIEPPERLVNEKKAEKEPESVTPESEPFSDQAPRRFRVEMWRDAKDEPVKWLIDKIVPEGGFMALYGPPGTFKSFIALHMAAMVASGQAWLGHEVHQQGGVLYVAGEGHGGIGTRIAGLRKDYGFNDIPVGVIRSQVNLRSSEADFTDLLLAIAESEIEKPRLIIIDTLARAFAGGNENASEDMGAFIAQCGRLQAATQAALLVVHHSGKDASLGLRGHSSFLGAVDTQIEITRHQEQLSGQLKLTKQKDGKDGIEVYFALETVALESPQGLGFEDNESSTLVVKTFTGELPDIDTFEPPQGKGKKTGRGKHQVVAREALRHVVKMQGEYRIMQGERHRCVTIDAWREEVYKRLGSDVEESDKRKRWKELRDTLSENGYAAMRDEWVWIALASEMSRNEF